MLRMTEFKRLGKSDLLVHPIGVGANAVGGHNLYGNLDEAAGKQLIHTALDSGINFIDTAFIYGPGHSERLIGEVISERGKREDVIIATKGAHKIVGQDVVMDNSPEYLTESVHGSLERLQTDYIDLFYIHFPDEATPKDEAIGALKRLKDEGKIRAIGVSNFSLEQLKQANIHGDVDVFQGEYNLLNRSAEQQLFPYLLEQQISFIPYFPLASGLLTGKYTPQTEIKDLRKGLPYFKEENFIPTLEKIEQLRPMAEAKGVEISHIVLAWYLTREAIPAIIPGAKNAQQVLANLKTIDVQLTADEISKIDQLFPA